jgi:uncharacterized membrane protein YkoI
MLMSCLKHYTGAILCARWEAAMTKRQIGRLMAVLSVLSAAVAIAEQKVQMKDLPPAVQQAVQANLNGGTLKGLSKEVEKGRTQYEVESTLNGRARDFLLDTAGRLIEVEEELAMDAVPVAVKAAAEARGKVLKIESVTRGKTLTYEAQIEKNGKKSEVALDADGKSPKR